MERLPDREREPHVALVAASPREGVTPPACRTSMSHLVVAFRHHNDA
jgi:hypothetical protein